MGLLFRSAPRISFGQFDRVLQKFASPCAPIAQDCYDIVCVSGIDPAIALAFFAKESVFGTRGLAVETKNWGNVRTPFRPERAIGTHPRNFAIYATWQDSLVDWCERINERYIRERGLDTVEKAIPVYAPSFDGNSVQGYINFVTSHVAQWMTEDGKQALPPTTPAAPASLREELLRATFAATGASFRPDTPIYQFFAHEAETGRPLGNPLGEVQRVTIEGQDYLMQVFALDTLYSPIASPDEIYRLSDLPKS